jgi:hypothetical protein
MISTQKYSKEYSLRIGGWHLHTVQYMYSTTVMEPLHSAEYSPCRAACRPGWHQEIAIFPYYTDWKVYLFGQEKKYEEAISCNCMSHDFVSLGLIYIFRKRWVKNLVSGSKGDRRNICVLWRTSHEPEGANRSVVLIGGEPNYPHGQDQWDSDLQTQVPPLFIHWRSPLSLTDVVLPRGSQLGAAKTVSSRRNVDLEEICLKYRYCRYCQGGRTEQD